MFGVKNARLFCSFYEYFYYFCRKEINMPQISTFYGIVIMMFFDDHNPPHFHVQYNECRAIINISNGMVTGQMPRRVLSLVYEWLDLHKDELMENWDLLKNRIEPKKINPLE